MKTIGIIRLHRWISAGTFVYDRLARFVDGLFFYANHPCSENLLQIAQGHPKCVDIRMDPTDWREHSHIHAGHLSQQRCMQWADEIKPKTVFIFDEDQAPPDRLGDEIDRWEDNGAQAIRFKWLWSWGSPLKVITGVMPCSQVWFTQGYRWHPKASSVLPASGNSIPYFGNSVYNCRYPGINLGVMTEDIRDWRTQKKRGWWLNEPFPVAAYNPDLTVAEMMQWPRG